MVLQCERQCISREVLCSKTLSGSTFLLPLLETWVWYRPACSSKPLSLASHALGVGPVEIQTCNPKKWPACYWTNPVLKRTSSRGISSVLSHLFGHGSGNFVHSSARCAWKENSNYLTNWLNWWYTLIEYMYLSGYEFRCDLHQNVLCCSEYISSVKLVNSSR